MLLEKLIGNENVPVRHRILNIVLLLGMCLAFISGLFNIAFKLGIVIITVSFLSGLFLTILYYCSITKRALSISIFLLVCICIGIITPAMWISNGGSQGGTSLYIIVFSSLIAALLEGSKKIAALSALVIASLCLMGLEYYYPALIVNYKSDLDRFADISFTLIMTLIANTVFLSIILRYYIKEQQKTKEFLSQLEQHKIELKYQRDLKVINEKLQQEIDEREQTEQALCNSEKRFLKVFQSSPIPMFILTSDGGVFVDVNDSFITVFDFTRLEIIDNTLSVLCIVDKQKNAFSVIMIQQKSIRNIDITFRTKSGQERIGLFSSEAIEINGKQHLLCIINDITERIRLEKEMAHLDRLNLVGEMAASIGHEVRNPLTTVRGFLQLFQRKEAYAAQKEYFDLMIEELDRANSIISEFLSLAKNKKVTLIPHSLNRIISKLYPLIQADAVGAGKNVTIELGDIPDVSLDENEMRQYILNIVRNGLEAVQPKGSIAIKTYREKSEIVLEIRDTGTGIPPEIFAKIGTPFVSTKDTGTGLGIAICYRIAEHHKAKIAIETDQHGTAFLLRFHQ